MLTDLVIILSVWSLLTIPLALLGGFIVELLEPRQTPRCIEVR